jgi:hypothetical protein
MNPETPKIALKDGSEREVVIDFAALVRFEEAGASLTDASSKPASTFAKLLYAACKTKGEAYEDFVQLLPAMPVVSEAVNAAMEASGMGNQTPGA